MKGSDALSALLPPEAMGASSEADLVGARVGRPPAFVVKPASAEEVSTVMTWANREGVGVLAMASGDRADPLRSDAPYVAVLTGRLTGVQQYEPADLTITAGAGSVVGDIDRELRAHGQWLPFDPAHMAERSLGGLAACGDSGPLWMGYGALRNHVLGMTVVTGDGRILRLGGRVVKNVAGFDLLKLMVGSRGSLGVITSLCVRAFPTPAVDHVLVQKGASLGDLTELAGLVGTAPVMPASCVLVDRCEAFDDEPALVVRLHGAERTVESDRRSLEGHAGVAFETADLPDRLVDVMRDHAFDQPAVLEACALPSRLGEVLGALEELQPAAVQVDGYGGRVRAGFRTFDTEAMEDACRSVERLGGSTRLVRAASSAFLAAVGSKPSTDEVDLIRSLRASFDPEGVLWPAHR